MGVTEVLPGCWFRLVITPGVCACHCECVCVFAAGGFKRHVILTAHGWTWQKKLQAIIFHLLAQTKV